MKTIRGVLCTLLLCAASWAQGPIPGNNVTDLSITFPVFGLNPVPVPGATIAVVGQAGQATWYFWASANYQLGDVISPIGSIQNAPNVLSSSNYVSIYPWQYPGGVASVDILATQTPLAPTGACNCAVATGLTSGGANFQSNSLNSYTVTLLNPAAFELQLTNEVTGSGTTSLLLRNKLTGALIANLSSSGAFSPGGDLSGSSSSQEVIGLLSHALPSLSVGYLNYNGTNWVLSAVSGAVSSVANSDGTLTISPTTGAVVASLNLGHANTWTAAQTLPSPILTGTPDASGATEFKLPLGASFATLANGEVGYDTTNKNWHVWQNGADVILAPLAAGFVSGDCGQPTSSGGVWQIADAGGACGTGSGGANTALSNLAAVSINTSLLAQTAVDLGSTSHPFRNVYFFGGGTYGTDSFELTGTSTANRTVTLPDNSGTVGELNLAQAWSAAQTFSAGLKVTTISDANGNPFLVSSATASAVDSVTVTNAATANPATVTIAASGSDANINLNLVSKGSGAVQCNGTTCATGSFNPTITSPQSTQTLSYNGSAWVNGYGGVNVDPQTGNYTFSCPTDRLGELEFDISSAGTLSLPQAGSTTCTGSSMALVVRNTSSSTAILTISATTSTFQPEGGSSISVLPGGAVFIYSDATTSTGNYHDLPVPTAYGGVNVQTANYTATLLDKDKLVVMNCSSACAFTMPATPPSSKWNSGVMSIGSTLATISLNSLNYNGGATAPALIKYMPLRFTTDGSNYYGDVPLVAGSGATLMPAANGVTIAASGASGVGTLYSTSFEAGTVTSGTTTYAPVSGPTAGATTEFSFSSVIGAACTAQNAYIVTNATNGAGTLTLTLRNGTTFSGMANTTLAPTVGNGAAAGAYSDTTHTVSIPAGSIIDWQLSMSAGTSGAIIGFGFQCK